MELLAEEDGWTLLQSPPILLLKDSATESFSRRSVYGRTCCAGCIGPRACAVPPWRWFASAGRLPSLQRDGQVSSSCSVASVLRVKHG